MYMYNIIVCIVVYLRGAEVCGTVLAYLFVFCLKIHVKEVFQDLSQWKVHLVIVHVYVCSCLQPLTQHLKLYTCCQADNIYFSGRKVPLPCISTACLYTHVICTYPCV